MGGSYVTPTALTIGDTVGSSGAVNITGVGSNITLLNGPVVVGSAGAGSLVVSGKVNTSGGNFTAGASTSGVGTIDIDGGQLALGAGSLSLGAVGSASLTVRTNGAISQTGPANLGNSTTTVTNGSTWAASAITVGSVGTASLTIEGGATINSSGPNQIGYSASGSSVVGSGFVNIFGAGWSSTGLFTLGGASGPGGNGTIHVGQGGMLTTTNAIVINPQGTLDIAGGSVIVDTLSPNGGRINWSSGSLTLTGGGGLFLNPTTFGYNETLSSSQTLSIAGNLNVPNNQLFTLAGGGVTVGSLSGTASSYHLQSGSLTLTNSNLTIGSTGPLGAIVSAPTGLALQLTAAGKSLNIAAACGVSWGRCREKTGARHRVQLHGRSHPLSGC